MNTSPFRTMLIALGRIMALLPILAGVTYNTTSLNIVLLGVLIWTIAEYFPKE